MDERVEEIRPISPVSPIRKLTLTRPKKGKRELTYQLNQYRKAKKTLRTDLFTKKLPDASNNTVSSSVPAADDYVAELKKRIAFDRAIIIGD
jgi:hypothetical protein